jgi:hypothetical protein
MIMLTFSKFDLGARFKRFRIHTHFNSIKIHTFPTQNASFILPNQKQNNKKQPKKPYSLLFLTKNVLFTTTKIRAEKALFLFSQTNRFFLLCLAIVNKDWGKGARRLPN